MRFIRRLATLFVVLLLLPLPEVVPSVSSPPEAQADHLVGSVKKEFTTRRGYDGRSSSWRKGSGGGTGPNGFYYASARSNRADRRTYAIWYMGSIRGEYKLLVYVPKAGASPEATASVRYRVQVKSSSGSWRTVQRYRLNQSTSKNWRIFNTPVTLNGEVRILVRDYEAHSGTIGIDSIELKRHAYHSDDIETAISACEESIVTLYTAGRWSAAGLAQLNLYTGIAVWFLEFALRGVIKDNESTLRSDCSRRFRESQILWMGPIPLRHWMFLSSNHNQDGSAKGAVIK